MAGQYELARKTLLDGMPQHSDVEDFSVLSLAFTDFLEKDYDACLAGLERGEAIAVKPGMMARKNGETSAFTRGFFHKLRSECYLALGLTEDSIEEIYKALDIAPDNLFHNRLLFTMNYHRNVSPELVCQEAARWNRVHAAPLAGQIAMHKNVPDPNRRIRVAYLSPDLYNHAIYKLIAPVLAHHDRSKIELFVYALGPASDDLTQILASRLEHFTRLPLSRDEIVNRVRTDEIDILVDLVGHSIACPDTYLAFALKPAPIQVSWTGVMATTGLTTMDYFIGDQFLPYPGTEHLFSEKVYRLPRISSCYQTFADCPAPAPSPFFSRGHITFGSYNDQRKVTREVVKLWSAILHLVPHSRMILKAKTFAIPLICDRYRGWFAEDGIAADRIDFAGISQPIQYLKSWGDVDIALDTFPYNGGTTTYDAVSVGVPVVTLYGRPTVQCAGTAIMDSIGLPAAQTPAQYIELALSFVDLVKKEPGLRARIVGAFKNSPISDFSGMTACLETAYRDMWQIWCHGRTRAEAGAA